MTGWQTASLGEISTLISRGVAPKYVEDGGIAVLNQKCVRDHTVNTQFARRHDNTVKHVKADKLVQLGDVLVNSTGTGTLGRVGFVSERLNEPTTVDTHVTIVRPKPGAFIPKFFGYMMVSIEDQLKAAGVGASGQTELSRTSIEEDFSVSFPTNLAEQQRIVPILDQAFEGIAKAKANAERNLANAKELYRSEFSSILRDAKGWKEVTLPAISKNLDGKRIPITRSDRVAGEIPYYGASGIVDYVEGFIFDDDILLVSEDGANLLARSTPIAFPVQGKCWVNNHAHVLKFEVMVVQRYVERYINHISIERFVTGAAQPKLTQASLNKIPILMPADITETANIAERLDELSELALSLQANAKIKVKHLESLQGAILHQAFSGNL